MDNLSNKLFNTFIQHNQTIFPIAQINQITFQFNSNGLGDRHLGETKMNSYLQVRQERGRGNE